MGQLLLSILATAFSLYNAVAGAGTTVFITVSDCPAPTGTLPTNAAVPTTFVLYVEQDDLAALPRRQTAAREYIGIGGMLTPNYNDALQFDLTSSGQLMVGEEYVSSSGSGTEAFAPSLLAQADDTLFSIVNGMLVWTNKDFTGSQAQFCIMEETVEVVFAGQPQDDCFAIDIGVEAANANLSSSSMTISTTMNLNGMPTLNTQTGSSSMSMASSSTTGTMSMTQSPYPAPTSSGEPNCLDRSPYDGTVNYNYLILCATDLQGTTLRQNDASNLADCIETCNAYIPTGNGQCVAVEYNTQATINACTLKSNISTINRGDNQYSQTAVIVNVPYAPPIVFAGVNGTSSTSTMTSTTLTTSIFASTSTTTTSISPPGITTTNPSLTLPTSGTTTSATCGPTPTADLCPNYDLQSVTPSDTYCYYIECSTSLQGVIAFGNSTKSNSLALCTDFCSLLNAAETDFCVGVEYIPTYVTYEGANLNCLIMSNITGITKNVTSTDSARLVYSGYAAGIDQ